MVDEAIYTRPELLIDTRMHYCPGCGHSMLHRILAELIEELKLGDRTVGVAPVGCSVIAYEYLDVDMTEAAHGRAPAVATGIKRARPDLFVFAYQGDGQSLILDGPRSQAAQDVAESKPASLFSDTDGDDLVFVTIHGIDNTGRRGD